MSEDELVNNIVVYTRDSTDRWAGRVYVATLDCHPLIAPSGSYSWQTVRSALSELVGDILSFLREHVERGTSIDDFALINLPTNAEENGRRFWSNMQNLIHYFHMKPLADVEFSEIQRTAELEFPHGIPYSNAPKQEFDRSGYDGYLDQTS